MQRHEVLKALSRDHHQALAVALVLRRADASTAAAARSRFLEFWREHGAAHFAEEEAFVLPAVPPADGGEREEVVQVLLDHVWIRRAAAGLGDADLDGLHALGERLEAHVRLEERRLFPLIEAELTDDELAALGRALGTA